MKIASLEDDLDQAQHIQQVLSAAGYTCTSYPRSLDLLAALRVQAFDLILLDWQLPDMNGDEVVRRLRTSYGFAVPIIFLTSRDQESDLVQGLQAGADDYIVKPMRPAELLARVAALLRRSQGALPDYLPFSVAGLSHRSQRALHRPRRPGRTVAAQGIRTRAVVFRNVGRLISRDVLAESVWNREIPATSRTLDTHLSNIRQKLQLRPQNGVRLSSSYALGYRLELVSDPQPQGDDAKDD